MRRENISLYENINITMRNAPFKPLIETIYFYRPSSPFVKLTQAGMPRLQPIRFPFSFTLQELDHDPLSRTASCRQKDWAENPRWAGIKRGYTAADVVRLRGSCTSSTRSPRGAEKLWNLVNTEPFVNALGALTGNQAMQQVKAGLKAIYLSGWQVAGDANSRRDVPRPVAVPVDSVPQGRQAHQQHLQARRPDPVERRQGRHRLLRSRSWPMPKPASAACSTPSN
jgi:hypothetical protein